MTQRPGMVRPIGSIPETQGLDAAPRPRTMVRRSGAEPIPRIGFGVVSGPGSGVFNQP